MANNCSSYTLNGITLGCGGNVGGIKKVWLSDFDAFNVTYTTLEDGTRTAITAMALIEGATLKEYQFRKGTANMNSSVTMDDTLGTFAVGTDLNLQFSKMESNKRLEMMALCLTPAAAIVLDNNGKYWFLGADNYVGASAASGETGTAVGDFGGYKCTLHDDARQFPFEIPADVVEGLLK